MSPRMKEEERYELKHVFFKDLQWSPREPMEDPE